MSISRDDWLKALVDAGVESVEHDANAVTVREFADMFDLNHMTANRRLDALVAAGKATKTKKRTKSANGRDWLLNAYRLTP